MWKPMATGGGVKRFLFQPVFREDHVFRNGLIPPPRQAKKLRKDSETL